MNVSEFRIFQELSEFFLEISYIKSNLGSSKSCSQAVVLVRWNIIFPPGEARAGSDHLVVFSAKRLLFC